MNNYIIGAFKQPCHITISFSGGKQENRSKPLSFPIFATSQVSVKRDKGKTSMVPDFQSLENISEESCTLTRKLL